MLYLTPKNNSRKHNLLLKFMNNIFVKHNSTSNSNYNEMVDKFYSRIKKNNSNFIVQVLCKILIIISFAKNQHYLYEYLKKSKISINICFS